MLFIIWTIFTLNIHHQYTPMQTKTTTHKQAKVYWPFPNLTPPYKNKVIHKSTPSILDEADPQSQLNRSSFRGFYNMALIFFFIYLFTQPIVNWVQSGMLLQLQLYNTFKNDFLLCIMIWPLFYLWSFTSFFLQKLIILGINPRFSVIFQHLTQAGLFIFSSYLIFSRNWCSSHTAFVIIQACAHFMKMHSYTTANRDYREQRQLAIKQGRQPMTNYPQNINLRDFNLFMWTPWLVYDTYPRRNSISIIYIVRKSIAIIFSLMMTYIIHTQYIIPLLEEGSNYNQLKLMFKGMLPGTFVFVLMFYIVFQNITNIFAEVTKLDNRQFYQDWWNSTTYEEFNRKWNKPVHLFLYRHVYLELILRWKMNKNRAQTVTFLFSAMLHEYLLAVIFRIIRPIFLFFIIMQVPLIYLTKFMKGKKSGKYLFWLGIIIGPSIIISSYLKVSDKVAQLFLRV